MSIEKKQILSLSDRVKALVATPARLDFELFMEANQNLYCPSENPDGAFPLNVAENHLMASTINQKLTSILQNNKIPDWVLNYTHLLGNVDVRLAVAQFMTKYLCKCPIAEDSIGLSSGAAAVIEVSSFVLANAGDVVVIPAPAYPMYTIDMGLKSGVERYDLQTHYDIADIERQGGVTVELLDKTREELNVAGKCFKMLLITSPDNPTGRVYTRQELETLADWCVSHKVHLIVNEIYALSSINTKDAAIKEEYKEEGEYSSFAQIMQQYNSDYLHLWYAFSKDFAMSGLRVGVVHSLNQTFMEAYANVNIPHMVSNSTQWMLAELLKDNDFLKAYIGVNQQRVTSSYKLVVEVFKRLNIPYVPSRGSFFIWGDFSQYLKADTQKGEEQLWLNIYKYTGVLLTPGAGFQHQKKGLFRLVFTAVPYKHLSVAMNRLETYLVSLER